MHHHTFITGITYCITCIIIPCFPSAQYEGITRSEYEDIPYVPPGEKLNTLYDQLANKKCIEIPRKHLKLVTYCIT